MLPAVDLCCNCVAGTYVVDLCLMSPVVVVSHSLITGLLSSRLTLYGPICSPIELLNVVIE